MNEKENSLRTLFIQAVEIADAAERAAYLQRTCGDDAALRQRLERLLKAHDEEGGFASAKGETNILPDREKPGDRIGRYKLREQIGHGGCGVVYVAEQEEPVRRRVALKVIKLGMDTRQVVARFEAERQALAMMDHPNIAKVLDAGATDTGRPYFVMELVRGIKITDYCDQNTLSTPQRLDLFIQVCRAIQHAHQKGIIHRDIKPSNILVTLHDSVPVPKVIDFGIAKATADQRLTDKTIYTAFEQFIGTPAYMSPEQAEMSGLDVDTRSDIYSLGVLLYELLTGRTPFDAKTLLRAGLDEMRRIIREQEPVKPSTRLSTLADADLTEVARHRQAEAPKLIHVVRGDLDWIVMKALEKDRARRYETANGLAMDIQRHLNNEPVVACPPTAGYRFRKLVERNKLAFTAASAITAALVIGLGISTWMFFHAQVEERKAKTEAAKATAISELLQQMLGSADPDALKGSEYTVRKLLDDFSEGLASQLKDQPEVEAAVRATIGRAYRHLGAADKAAEQHERALTLRRRVFGEQAEPVADSLVDYAWTFFEKGHYEATQYAKGEIHAREALDIYRKRGAARQKVISALLILQRFLIAEQRFAHVDALTQEALAAAGKSPAVEYPELASMIHGLAEVKNSQSQFAEAESLAREGVEMHRRLRGAEHTETAWALHGLAIALRGQRKLTEAEAALQEALKIFRKYYTSEHKSVVMVMEQLKLVLEARGDSAALEALERERLADAKSLLRTALPRGRVLTADESNAVANALHKLGDLLRDSGQWAKAEEAFREAVAIRRKLFGNEHLDLAHSLHGLAWVLNHNGKRSEAEALSHEELAMRRKLLGSEHPDVATTLADLAVFLRDQGKLPEAESVAREVLAIRRKRFGNEHRAVDDSLGSLARVLHEQGKLAEAEAVYREELSVEKKLSGEEHPFVANSLNSLAAVLRDQGELVEAEAVIREALAILRKLQGNDDPALAATLAELTSILLAEEKFAEAEPMARECLAIREKKLPDDWRTFNARAMLGRALLGQKKFAEAEPLLLAGYAGMKQREDKIPAIGKARLKETLQSLVQLYEATHRPEQAAEWKRKLASWNAP
jgi:tetratricopeptide (TPR) repeat protein/tRNA A-37 threonylcarbamoyl transferase component Bud32